MTNKKWGHDELAHDLASHLKADSSVMAWENMQLGPSGSSRPDVFALNKSYSRFCPKIYEVKVSVSDFRSDITSGKWQRYLEYSSAVIFAVPAGLVAKNDVPDGCGLIVRNETGWRNIKKPTLQHVETLPHKAWMKLLIDGVDRLHDGMSIERKSIFSRYDAERRLQKAHGEEVATLVAKALRAKEILKLEIAEDERRMNEIRAGQNRRVEAAIESATADLRAMNYAQADLIRALGLDAGASPVLIASACREASRRLSEDGEILRLRECFSVLKRQLDSGLIPLPFELEQEIAE